jgi:hypothetical protein
MARKVWVDIDGDVIPAKLVGKLDKTREKMIQKLVAKAKRLEAALIAFQEQCADEITTYLGDLARTNGMVWEGKNVKIMSYSGRETILISVAKRIAFDERLQLAKQKIDAYIESQLPGSTDELKYMVSKVFQIDQEGNVDAKLISEIQTWKINDPLWLVAMDLINISRRVAASKQYTRLYERIGDSDKQRYINLNFSSVTGFEDTNKE